MVLKSLKLWLTRFPELLFNRKLLKSKYVGIPATHVTTVAGFISILWQIFSQYWEIPVTNTVEPRLWWKVIDWLIFRSFDRATHIIPSSSFKKKFSFSPETLGKVKILFMTKTTMRSWRGWGVSQKFYTSQLSPRLLFKQHFRWKRRFCIFISQKMYFPCF